MLGGALLLTEREPVLVIEEVHESHEYLVLVQELGLHELLQLGCAEPVDRGVEELHDYLPAVFVSPDRALSKDQGQLPHVF